MLNRITIGKYVYGNSIVHNWNPIIKLVCSLFYIASLFLFSNLYSMIFFVFLVIFLLFFSKISLKVYLKVVWQIRYILFFLILFNCLFGTSLSQNLVIILQLVCALLYSTVVLFTTPISDLTYAIMVLLSPLTIFRIPIPMISHMIGLALSFLSNMLVYTNQILKSLSARGMDYFHCSLMEKVKVWKLILNLLFAHSIQHADEIANTMEIRLYEIDSKRIIFRKFNFSYYDVILLIFHFIFFLL